MTIEMLALISSIIFSVVGVYFWHLRLARRKPVLEVELEDADGSEWQSGVAVFRNLDRVAIRLEALAIRNSDVKIAENHELLLFLDSLDNIEPKPPTMTYSGRFPVNQTVSPAESEPASKRSPGSLRVPFQYSGPLRPRDLKPIWHWSDKPR